MLATDAQGITIAAGQTNSRAPGIPGPDHGLSRLHEAFACLCQTATAFVAIEQSNPQRVFQLLDPLGHCRGAGVHALRRSDKAAPLRCGKECSGKQDIH